MRELAEALRAILKTTGEERQNPAVWFPRVDAARAALKAWDAAAGDDFPGDAVSRHEVKP